MDETVSRPGNSTAHALQLEPPKPPAHAAPSPLHGAAARPRLGAWHGHGRPPPPSKAAYLQKEKEAEQGQEQEEQQAPGGMKRSTSRS